MPGQDTIFNISGKVVNSAGTALASRPVRVQLGYHEFVDGESVASEPIQGETTDANGMYSFSWHVATYDTNFGFSVVTKSNDANWKTTTDGEYLGNPTGSPVAVGVSNTVLDPNPGGGGGG